MAPNAVMTTYLALDTGGEDRGQLALDALLGQIDRFLPDALRVKIFTVPPGESIEDQCLQWVKTAPFGTHASQVYLQLGSSRPPTESGLIGCSVPLAGLAGPCSLKPSCEVYGERRLKRRVQIGVLFHEILQFRFGP